MVQDGIVTYRHFFLPFHASFILLLDYIVDEMRILNLIRKKHSLIVHSTAIYSMGSSIYSLHKLPCFS